MLFPWRSWRMPCRAIQEVPPVFEIRNPHRIPDKFLAGEYAGDYEAGLIKELHKLLPDTPPWKQ